METTSRILGVYDEAGRYLGPAEVAIRFFPRPAGPWDTNTPVDAPLVKVCSWCPTAAEQTAAARAHGFEVTHGICDVCSARVEAEWAAFSRGSSGGGPRVHAGRCYSILEQGRAQTIVPTQSGVERFITALAFE
jgi:hypothetical protein